MRLGASELYVLLVIAVVPLAIFAGLQAWALALVRRGAAPGWSVWVLPVMLVLGLAAGLAGTLAAVRSIEHVPPADRATILAASIAESMNAGACLCFPAPLVWAGVLIYFTTRRRS